MKKLSKISMLAALLMSAPLHAVTVSDALDALENQTSAGHAVLSIPSPQTSEEGESAAPAAPAEQTLILSECHGWGDAERITAFFDKKPEIKQLVFKYSSLDTVGVFDALGAGRFEVVDFRQVFFPEEAFALLPHTFSCNYWLKDESAGGAFIRSTSKLVTIQQAYDTFRSKLTIQLDWRRILASFTDSEKFASEREKIVREASHAH
jgi:hypothetical protein